VFVCCLVVWLFGCLFVYLFVYLIHELIMFSSFTLLAWRLEVCVSRPVALCEVGFSLLEIVDRHTCICAYSFKRQELVLNLVWRL
jgi:hypothetical protein